MGFQGGGAVKTGNCWILLMLEICDSWVKGSRHGKIIRWRSVNPSQPNLKKGMSYRNNMF